MIATLSIPQERPRRVSARREHFRGGYKKRAPQFDDLADPAPIVRCGMNQAGDKLRADNLMPGFWRAARNAGMKAILFRAQRPHSSLWAGDFPQTCECVPHTDRIDIRDRNHG